MMNIRRLFLAMPVVALSFTSFPLSAQANRNVVLSWAASTTPGVTGTNVYRATSPTGPFTKPLNVSPITDVTFTDTTAVIGQTYSYVVTAITPPCTNTTPATTACGESTFSAPATTTVPPKPTVTITLTVTVP